MLPSLKEEHLSQLPALQLLINLGFEYLTPEQTLAARGGRTGAVLLEDVLRKQLSQLNQVEHRGKSYPFSEANLATAVLKLRDLPIQNGFLSANSAFYDLVTLGTSLEQSVEGDKKSFSFRYIDWKQPKNNVFHVTEEFSVLRQGRNEHYRPDIVLFINGIPMVVIECKSPTIKDPVNKGIEQHERNQQADGIRSLYQYSNIVMSLAVDEARYATTGTSAEFWSVWKESFRQKTDAEQHDNTLLRLVNTPLPKAQEDRLFEDRFAYVRQYMKQLSQQDRLVTEQDRLIYNLCRPDRLLDLMYNFILFDDGAKKITRYQQYFAIRKTLEKISHIEPDGSRTGGVIWHTQGSGKSLTMVMLAQLLAQRIKNPKIILVTDRVDLDNQITATFGKCGVEVTNAATGSHLVELLTQPNDAVITTVIHKFEAAVRQCKDGIDTPNIFVLIDEGHRSQYGSFNVKMRRVFPTACFIAFTGTPLMKDEKNTAYKFGGLIDVYSINDAVADKAVVPLLYEGRHNQINVNERPLDNFFEQVAEPLNDYGKAELKRKFSRLSIVNSADQVIYERALDIVKHYVEHFQLKEKNQKAILVTPNKLSAVKYKAYIDDFCKNSEKYKIQCEVVMSAPDDREGEEDAFEKSEDQVKNFWAAMLDKHGSKEQYETHIINAFKKQEQPDMLIVVDKLLTGFDAPCATVLYLTRPLREHTLLQAIARVNRLYPGKDYGYIIDYYGNLEHLDSALETYAGKGGFEQEDLQGTVTKIAEEIEKMPQAHSELWDIFKEIKNKYDQQAYKALLFDEAIRYVFYEKLNIFARLLKMCLTSLEFEKNTPEAQIKKYKEDLKFFLGLREIVRYAYSDDLPYEKYEKQVQKLIDKHVTTEGEVLKLTDLINIFDQEKRTAEIERLSDAATRADHIATRTVKAINVKMNEDATYYKKLSQLLRNVIEDYHAQRLSEAAYLAKVLQIEKEFLSGSASDAPESIRNNSTATAFYHTGLEILKTNKEQSAMIALGVDTLHREILYPNNTLLIDWQNKPDVEGKLKIAIDDFLFDTKTQFNLNLTFEQIDNFIDELIKISKLKYNL